MSLSQEQGRPDKVHSNGAAAGDRRTGKAGEGDQEKGTWGEGEGEVNPGCTHRPGAAAPHPGEPSHRPGAPGSQGLLKAWAHPVLRLTQSPNFIILKLYKYKYLTKPFTGFKKTLIPFGWMFLLFVFFLFKLFTLYLGITD